MLRILVKILNISVLSLFLIQINCGDSGTQLSISTPSIQTFLESPSSQFIVDFSDIVDGNPYLGTNNSDGGHTGGHVYFYNNGSIPEGSVASEYPPIYAVADGEISRVDNYYELSTTGDVRYGLNIAFANDEGSIITFQYSIEPMMNPNDEDAYKRFILVEVGDIVEQGDIIAYMYTPVDNSNTHIHFNLAHDSKGFQSPSIFSNSIVTSFFEIISGSGRWTSSVEDEVGSQCMGYNLNENENVFGTGAVSCL